MVSSGIDTGSIRRKYAEERAKRLRGDGVGQYRRASGELGKFQYDARLEHLKQRDGVREEIGVLVVGAGISGLVAAVHLRQLGIESLRVVDEGGDFGGTWYWNQYPGAQCDVESYVYLPMLEEMGYVPTERYAHQPEIAAYLQSLARRHDLHKSALFATKVARAEWSESDRHWLISTDRGDEIRARFVVVAPGGFHQPKLPGIAGIENFSGHMFHTSRWDYAYTGGSTAGGLVNLRGKRVAIIGTGATSVQAVPYVAEYAEHLYVVQRTPISVSVRDNRPTDPEWARQLLPGWHQRRRENFTRITSGESVDEDLVDDGWTRTFKKLNMTDDHSLRDPSGAMEPAEYADFLVVRGIHQRIDSIVKDPSTAESLKPYYRFMCKRPGFHDEYLATFNRPNVTLVDTEGNGVEMITEDALVACGQKYVVDCIVFATGFDQNTGYTRSAGFDMVGVGGQLLSAEWADGIRSYQGLHAHNFPNCLFIGHTQAGIGINVSHSLSEQASHAAQLISSACRRGYTRVEATKAAVDQWDAAVRDVDPKAIEFLRSCTPSYFNAEGDPRDGRRQFGVGSKFSGTPMEYFALLAAWREAGSYEGLTVS